MEKGYTQNFFYHRIPEAANIGKGLVMEFKSKPAKIFGLLDSSGSMSSDWKYVAENYNALMDDVDQSQVTTLCFYDKVIEEPNKKVDASIKKYGAGSTNILKVFEEFEKRLDLLPKEDEVKVVFLSDGQDTCNQNLQEKLKGLKGAGDRKITFMCLGVKSGFPTFISMYLREKYHRGDATCPSIFLVEYSSDKAFFNKFQSIRPFFETKAEIKVDPEQFLFPWESVAPTVPEGRWIMSEDRVISLNGGAGKIEYLDSEFSVDAVIDIFRSWTQKLQLDSINKKITPAKTKEFAESTYNLMMDIITDIKKARGINLLPGSEGNSAKEDFLSRVLNQQIKRTSSRIVGYIQSMKELKEGLNLQSLSEFEAAKIIGLGTIVGKHQQRALAMKNITKTKFKQMVQEFFAVLSSTTLVDHTDTAPAWQTGQTPNQLFLDPTLKSGLEKIESPLDFLEVFPLQGIPVKLKRNDGVATDPWKIEVKDLSLVTKSVDASQFDLAIHKVNIPENNVDVEYQAFIPLLGKLDSQLAPFFATELIKYALSYNVSFEIDEICDEAYLSLLANLFEAVIKKTDDYSKQVVELILSSLKAISGESGVKRIIEGFKSGDADIMSQTATKTNLFYLMVYYISKELGSKEESEEFAEKLWIVYFSKKLEAKKVTDFITSDQEIGMKEEVKKKYTAEYVLKTFFTGKQIKNHIKIHLEKEIKSNDGLFKDSKVCLNKSIYTADTNENLSFELTQNLTNEIAGLKLADDQVLNYLAHCVSFSSIKDRLSNLISSDNAASVKILSKDLFGKDEASKKLIKKVHFQLLDELSQLYYKEFKRTHWNMIPATEEQIRKDCATKKIDFDSLKFDKASGFCKEACVCQSCPWYLFVRKKERSLRNHLGGWQNFLPRGFNSYIRAHPSDTAAAMYEEFIVKRGNAHALKAVDATPEQCIEYIQKLKDFYAPK